MNDHEQALFDSAISAAQRWHDFGRWIIRTSRATGMNWNAAYPAFEKARRELRRARIFRRDDYANG